MRTVAIFTGSLLFLVLPCSAAQKGSRTANRFFPVLISTDTNCTVTIDDESSGTQLSAEKPISVKLSAGEHLIVATTSDNKDTWRKVIKLEKPEQTVVAIALIPVKEAREQSEIANAELAKAKAQEAAKRAREQTNKEQQQGLAGSVPTIRDGQDHAQDLEDCMDPKKWFVNVALHITYCTHAIESGALSNSDLIKALKSRSFGYWLQHDYDRAIQDDDQVIRLNPSDSSALQSRAGEYMLKGDFDRSIQDYDQAILLNPNDIGNFTGRADTYRAKGDYSRSIQDYDHAIELNSKDSRGFAGRADVYEHQGDFDRSIEDYDQAIRLDPIDFANFIGRGGAYELKGDYGRSIKDFDQAIRMSPRPPSFLFEERGIVRFDQGQFAEAASDFARGVELNPKDSNALIWLYISQARQGPGADRVLSASGDPDLKVWPGPIVSLFRGAIAQDAALASADDADPTKRVDHLCEAHFFIGENYLIRGDRLTARGEFELAKDNCRITSDFRVAASVEMRREGK